MTSSTAAVLARVRPAGHVYTEADWNDVDELRTRGLWYAIGKTRQEQAAWAFVDAAKAAGKPCPKLICMNPCMIGGPTLQPELNASSENVLYLLDGTRKRIPNGPIPWVE